ncbi:MAG: ABC transporter permease [Acidimicrobiia bacterium]
MGAAGRIAAKDLRLRIRDRSAIIIGILAPLALAFIFNVVFGTTFDSGGLALSYGLVDEDGSEISTALGDILGDAEDEGILTLERIADVAAAEAAIESGQIDAFLLVSEGFEQQVVTGGEPVIEVVGDIDEPTATQIASSIAEQFAIGVEASRLAVATTASLSGSPATPELIASLRGDPRSAAFSYELVDDAVATRQLDGATYFAAGMAVFFLFFTVQFGVLGLLEEERDGTLPRLLAAPVGRVAVVAGKALLAFALGLISMTVLVVGTRILMGAEWGAPLGVALLVVAGVLSAVGIMGLVAAGAQTAEGAGNLGSIIAIILGMLGGVFFPIGGSGDLLSRLTYIAPHAWFLRGMGDLANGAPWTSALPSVGAMLVFALVTGSLAWLMLRRKLLT